MPHIRRAILCVPTLRGERAVCEALRGVEGVRTIAVNVPAEQVEVDYDENVIPIERIEAVLRAGDYPVAATRLHRRRLRRPTQHEKECST